MWLSTVRVPDASAQSQTSASSRSRVSTARGSAGQADQQVELGRRQVHLDAGPAHPALGSVDLQIAEHDERRSCAAPACRAARSTRRSSACTRAASSRMENGLVM